MTTSKKTIQHIANLIKLEVDEKTSEAFSSQVSEILSYVDVLKELDTKDVIPTNQVTGLKNIFRDDIVEEYPYEKRQKLFREVPEMRASYIVVPHTITKLS